MEKRFIDGVDEDSLDAIESCRADNNVEVALTAVETFAIEDCEFVDLATTDVEAFANILTELACEEGTVVGDVLT